MAAPAVLWTHQSSGFLVEDTYQGSKFSVIPAAADVGSHPFFSHSCKKKILNLDLLSDLFPEQ